MYRLFTNRNSTRRPRLEVLEDRLALSCTVGLSGDTLTIIGDSANDRIIVRDDGKGHVSGEASGLAFSAYGVKTINISSEGGDDEVFYALDGDLAANQMRFVNVGLEEML